MDMKWNFKSFEVFVRIALNKIFDFTSSSGGGIEKTAKSFCSHVFLPIETLCTIFFNSANVLNS